MSCIWPPRDLFGIWAPIVPWKSCDQPPPRCAPHRNPSPSLRRGARLASSKSTAAFSLVFICWDDVYCHIPCFETKLTPWSVFPCKPRIAILDQTKQNTRLATSKALVRSISLIIKKLVQKYCDTACVSFIQSLRGGGCDNIWYIKSWKYLDVLKGQYFPWFEDEPSYTNNTSYISSFVPNLNCCVPPYLRSISDPPFLSADFFSLQTSVQSRVSPFYIDVNFF